MTLIYFIISYDLIFLGKNYKLIFNKYLGIAIFVCKMYKDILKGDIKDIKWTDIQKI